MPGHGQLPAPAPGPAPDHGGGTMNPLSAARADGRDFGEPPPLSCSRSELRDADRRKPDDAGGSGDAR